MDNNPSFSLPRIAVPLMSFKKGLAQRCQLCLKNYGSFFKEHQCKRCNRSVCDGCSKSKARPSSDHRICKVCKQESDFQAELRKNGDLHFGVSSQIGKDWAKSLGLSYDNENDHGDNNANLEPEVTINSAWTFSEIKKSQNFSQLEFSFWICAKENEDKVNLLMRNILQRIMTHFGWKQIPSGIVQLCLFLLMFCQESLALAILIHLIEKIFPDYVKEYCLNGQENESWNEKRQELTQICRLDVGLNEVEAKAAGAFMLNEGLPILSSLLIHNLNVQCFFKIFSRIVSLGKFEACEKAFLAMIKDNISSIKENNQENLFVNILRNTQAEEIEKIVEKQEPTFHSRTVSLRITSKIDEQNQELKMQLEIVKKLLEQREKEQEREKKENETYIRNTLENERQLLSQQLKGENKKKEETLNEREQIIIEKEEKVKQEQERMDLKVEMEKTKMNIIIGKMTEKIELLETQRDDERKRAEKERKKLIESGINNNKQTISEISQEQQILKLTEELKEAKNTIEELKGESDKKQIVIAELKEKMQNAEKKEIELLREKAAEIDRLVKLSQEKEEYLRKEREQQRKDNDNQIKLLQDQIIQQNNIEGKQTNTENIEKITINLRQRIKILEDQIDQLKLQNEQIVIQNSNLVDQLRKEKEAVTIGTAIQQQLHSKLDNLQRDISIQQEEHAGVVLKLKKRESELTEKVELKTKAVQEFYSNQSQLINQQEQYLQSVTQSFERDKYFLISKHAEQLQKQNEQSSNQSNQIVNNCPSCEGNSTQFNGDNRINPEGIKELNRVNQELQRILNEKETQYAEQKQKEKLLQEKIEDFMKIKVSDYNKIISQIQLLKQSGSNEQLAELLEKFATGFKTQLDEKDQAQRRIIARIEDIISANDSLIEENEEQLQLLLSNNISIPSRNKAKYPIASSVTTFSTRKQRTDGDEDEEQRQGCSGPSGCFIF